MRAGPRSTRYASVLRAAVIGVRAIAVWRRDDWRGGDDSAQDADVWRSKAIMAIAVVVPRSRCHSMAVSAGQIIDVRIGLGHQAWFLGCLLRYHGCHQGCRDKSCAQNSGFGHRLLHRITSQREPLKAVPNLLSTKREKARESILSSTGLVLTKQRPRIF